MNANDVKITICGVTLEPFYDKMDAADKTVRICVTCGHECLLDCDCSPDVPNLHNGGYVETKTIPAR